jgi:preprotein translocase subunit SecE
MTESVNKAEKVQKKGWFKGLKSEFSKVIWTDPETLAKQTVAVVSITCFLGVLITIIDVLVKQLIDLIM